MPGVLKGQATVSCFPKVYNPLQRQLTIQGQGPGNEHRVSSPSNSAWKGVAGSSSVEQIKDL